MITLTSKNHTATFANNLLPDVCLQVCGGGYTVAQTRKAMELQSRVLADGQAKIKGVTIMRDET